MKEIQLTRGMVAIVDDEDFEWLNQWKWCARKFKHTFYAGRSIRNGERRTTVLMHRLIMCVSDPNVLVDHEDHNGLHNWRSNLRPCTKAENNRNKQKQPGKSSKYKGVSFRKAAGRWVAKIRHNDKTIDLGLFDTEEEAAFAYDAASIKFHGDFGKRNTPDGVEIPLVVSKRTNNRSGWRGVHLSKDRKWIAQIKLSEKKHYLGCFSTPEAAAIAYDEAAKRLHGDKARLNFPLEQQCQ